MSKDLVTRLRLQALHNGHSSDAHVNFCADVHKAADHIEAQSNLIEEMREALEAIYRHIDGPENYDRHIDAVCDSILSKAKSQQEGETE